ncbi:unnamed protein product, partial [Prorocentrum cordatum]
SPVGGPVLGRPPKARRSSSFSSPVLLLLLLLFLGPPLVAETWAPGPGPSSSRSGSMATGSKALQSTCAYIEKVAGEVRGRVQQNKVPSPDQLASYVKQVVDQLQKLTKGAPQSIKDRMSGPWGGLYDFAGNRPLKPMTVHQFLEVLEALEADFGAPAVPEDGVKGAAPAVASPAASAPAGCKGGAAAAAAPASGKGGAVAAAGKGGVPAAAAPAASKGGTPAAGKGGAPAAAAKGGAGVAGGAHAAPAGAAAPAKGGSAGSPAKGASAGKGGGGYPPQAARGPGPSRVTRGRTVQCSVFPRSGLEARRWAPAGDAGRAGRAPGGGGSAPGGASAYSPGEPVAPAQAPSSAPLGGPGEPAAPWLCPPRPALPARSGGPGEVVPREAFELEGAEVEYRRCAWRRAAEIFAELSRMSSWQRRPIRVRDRETRESKEVPEGRPTVSFSTPPGMRYGARAVTVDPGARPRRSLRSS